MSNSTRNVIIDDAEKPNYIPSPQLDPIGYERTERYSGYRPHQRVNWRLWFIVGLLLFFVTGLSCIALKAFVEYRYAYDRSFHTIVDVGMNVATIAAFVALALVALAIAGAALNLAVKAGIFELPGGMAAHAIDLVVDWRRVGTRALAESTLTRHFDVQHALAEKSIYRNVTTFSPSHTIHYGGDDGDDDALDVLPSIPTFSDIMNNGHVGNNNGLMFGVVLDGGIV
jgi:hypothetical protein